MRDVELYRALLVVTAPWTVAGVDVDLKGQRVVVRVETGPGPYPCPECGTPIHTIPGRAIFINAKPV